MDTLYFHDLPRAPEGTRMTSVPADLADEMFRRHHLFVMDQADENMPPIDVLGFIVTGPERLDRYGLMVRADLIPTRADLDAHRDAIKRTMPTGWHLVVRAGTF